MTVRLVVARHSEPLDWLSDLPDGVACTVYNKGQPHDRADAALPNVGREAHTYLHHIVATWDDLDDYTIFVQGNPFEHARGFTDALRDFVNARVKPQFYDFADRVLPDESMCDVCPPYPWVPMCRVYETLFDAPAPPLKVEFGAGAQFAVSRDRIRAHPKAMYERALALAADDTSKSAWAFERHWRTIFA